MFPTHSPLKPCWHSTPQKPLSRSPQKWRTKSGNFTSRSRAESNPGFSINPKNLIGDLKPSHCPSPIHLSFVNPIKNGKISYGNRRMVCKPCGVSAVELMATWGASGWEFALELFNPYIFQATLAASWKLMLTCMGVGWLLRTGRIPDNTSEVLSKVAFNLCIPCMLFTKVGSALAIQRNLRLLFVPLTATMQVCFGCLLGWAISTALTKGPLFFKVESDSALPRPPRSAKAIAQTTALALGNPMAATALVQKPSRPPVGLSRMVAVACAFGNSLTLPLLFLLTLLPASLADSATAYTALYLMGWSPIFWTLGYYMLNKQDRQDRTAVHTKRMSVDMPLLPGLLPARVYTSTSQPVNDAITMDPSLTQKLSGMFSKAREFVSVIGSRMVNPPILAIMAGVVVGLSPLGRALWLPKSQVEGVSGKWATAVVASGVSMLKTVIDVMTTLGSATLPLQAVVLASSMFKRNPEEDEDSGGWRSLVFPEGAYESQALILVGIARLVIMPVFGVASLMLLTSWKLLPQDPVCYLAILLQCAMPSAQNMVLIMNLSNETESLAPMTAKFLLRLYLLSIVPLTIWATIFATITRVQLA